MYRRPQNELQVARQQLLEAETELKELEQQIAALLDEILSLTKV